MYKFILSYIGTLWAICFNFHALGVIVEGGNIGTTSLEANNNPYLNMLHMDGAINLLAVNETEFVEYTTQITRFKKPLYQYNANNAAALTQINFNVSRACGNGDLNMPPPPGFNYSIPISGIDPNFPRTTALYAYILVSIKLNMVVLSFTGSQTLSNLQSDFDFSQVPPTALNNSKPGMGVHQGFYNVYVNVQQAIRDQLANLLNKKTQFIITGHSLGGALTTLAAFDLAHLCPIVYSFASPRVGNPYFAQTYNLLKNLGDTWRVFNTEDIIPNLPPPEIPLGIILPIEFVFEHVGNPVPFTINEGTVLDNHIKAYSLVIINQMPPDNPNGICPNRFNCSEKKFKKNRKMRHQRRSCCRESKD